MHMPESILILHQLKVAHEALNGDREERTFFLAFCPEAFQVPKMMESFFAVCVRLLHPNTHPKNSLI